ncbi:GNAT family N-acetyltransferase [Salmonella enterica subsp. enterica]|nr:GNAT family N-acetyltransferase [Salmonella enterica subsp. enterica]ECC2069772.1 GNAT family N-acetyltransferase [Salmonella enterica]ECG6539849.1 GNAT family N-acetyltransferase [Salmonella enterica subsp. enterica serovar Frintrop]
MFVFFTIQKKVDLIIIKFSTWIILQQHTGIVLVLTLPLKYSGVGKELIQHTINYACSNWGYRPGFCLHALPSAEGFYNHLGMTDFGVDHEKENLRFYEASQVVASTLGGISNAA